MHIQQYLESLANILIVDDMPNNLRVLSEILQQQGYLVRLLRDGEMVLPSTLNSPPDLILLDIMMPGMDGYEVCQQLKADERTRDIPIIFLSALDEIADKVKAFEVGGVDYITKPFQAQEVLVRVKTQLELQQVQRYLHYQNARLQEEIAERKRAEDSLTEQRNLLQTVIDNLPDYIFVKDLSSRFILNNAAHLHVLGAANQDEVFGETDFSHFPEELATQYYADEQVVLKSGRALTDREECTLTPEGATQWLLTTKIPLRNQQGAIVGLVGISRDITQRKRMEDELRELNASKDKFFSIISHDLRSPFNALLGFSELLLQNAECYMPDKVKNYAEKLHASADRLYTLLENLLTWSRIQRGVMEYQPETLDLVELVDDNILLFHAQAEQKQVLLTCMISEDLEAYGDPSMVNTVLRNLISNALKFTGSGDHVTIFAHRQEDMVEIAVADTGNGIQPEDLPNLFRLDVRHSTPGTSGEQGTGLGLLLCQDLVQKHGGRIWAESELGKGTTFRFTLPHP